MTTQTDRHAAADAIPRAAEGEAAFDAWTLDELDDDLGSLRAALMGTDDVGG
jgi:hypothetical protein